MKEIELEYFEWICDKIIDEESNIKYSKLLSHLYDREFTAVIDMDNNRVEDGKTLRRRFELETGIPRDVVINSFKEHPYCSVLEMIVALAIRCEETIMTDDEYGDRTGEWFWNMIVSLGLGSMNDTRYNERKVDNILDKFIDRDYQDNGKGGLFTIEKSNRDMRNIEIWYQMCWYLDSI